MDFGLKPLFGVCQSVQSKPTDGAVNSLFYGLQAAESHVKFCGLILNQLKHFYTRLILLWLLPPKPVLNTWIHTNNFLFKCSVNTH